MRLSLFVLVVVALALAPATINAVNCPVGYDPKYCTDNVSCDNVSPDCSSLGPNYRFSAHASVCGCCPGCVRVISMLLYIFPTI